MLKLNDIFPARYLKAPDLQGKEWTLTIDRLELEAMGRTREEKPVLYFVGAAKALKLNVTMARAIAQIAGSENTDDWRGVQVCLFATFADFGKQTFPVVRIKAPIAKPRAIEQGRRA
jgi:hypothetical protein